MEYQIRAASTDDLQDILLIYEQARNFMAERGNPTQWGSQHPPKEQLEDDIRCGNLYVILSDGCIHGVFAFLIGEDPTYQQIWDGDWHRDELYGTIHRIAGDGSGGILRSAVSFCQQKTEYLRIDTHQDNLPMLRGISREGFSRCGIIYVGDGTPRVAFDRYRSNP